MLQLFVIVLKDGLDPHQTRRIFLEYAEIRDPPVLEIVLLTFGEALLRVDLKVFENARAPVKDHLLGGHVDLVQLEVREALLAAARNDEVV